MGKDCFRARAHARACATVLVIVVVFVLSFSVGSLTVSGLPLMRCCVLFLRGLI